MGEAQIPVRQNWRTRTSEDADWPDSSPPAKRMRESISDFLCDQCTLMFSHRGLETLNSPNGFRHQSRTNCLASGYDGCRICEFVFRAVCKEDDKNWAGEDRLIFRNLKSACSTSTISSIGLPGMYGLKGSLESEPDKYIITIYVFAERSK